MSELTILLASGIDMTHNPEFTTCEFYMAYADYNDLMKMTEELVTQMVTDTKGTLKVQYHVNGHDKEPITIDFTPPYRRIPMISTLEDMLSVKFPTDLNSEGKKESFSNLSCAHWCRFLVFQ